MFYKDKNNQLCYKHNAVQFNLDTKENCIKALHTRFQDYPKRRSLIDRFNQDSDAIGLFNRALQQTLPEVIRRRKTTTDPDFFIPTRGVSFGLKQLNSVFVESAGDVSYGYGSDDINHVSTKFREEPTKLANCRLGLKWNRYDLDSDLQQLATDYLAGISIIEENINNTYDIFQEAYVRDSFFGIPSQGITGLLTDPDSPEEIVTDFYPYDVNTTRADIVNWLKNLIKIISANSGRFGMRPDTMLISEDLMFRLMDISDTTDVELTAYELITRQLRDLGVTNLKALPELSQEYLERFGVFTTGSNQELIKIYTRDRQCLEKYVTPVRYTPPKEFGLIDYVGMMERKMSSINNKYPLESLNVIYPTTQAP